MSLALQAEINRLDKDKPKDDRWKKGPSISKDDLKNAKQVDDICEHFGRRKVKEIQIGSDADARIPDLIKFGKYKGKTYDWVYKNDRGYHIWACENINQYERNAKATIKK